MKIIRSTPEPEPPRRPRKLKIIRSGSLATYPPKVRNTDPETSHEAAKWSSARQIQMVMMLRAYAAHPAGLTAEEAADHAGIDPESTPWTRSSQLLRQGKLQETGLTRPSRKNRPQKVRRITDEGWKYLEASLQ